LEDTTIEDVLKTVETLYAQKDFAKALELLEAKKDSISEGLWHYNVGTLQAQLGNLPLARFHFLKSDLAGHSTREVLNNKELVETKLEIPRLEAPLSTKDYLIKGSMLASQGLMTSIGLIVLIIGLITFWKKKSGKALLASVLIGVSIIGLNWWIQSWHKVIVLKPQGILEGPSAIFSSRDELPAGVMLVVSEKEGWFEIKYPSRFQGWIKNSELKEL
jgi:hypothetical protein